MDGEMMARRAELGPVAARITRMANYDESTNPSNGWRAPEADEAQESESEVETETEADIESLLIELLEGTEDEVSRVTTFADAGLLTRDAGIVVQMLSGKTYQITIVEDRRAR